MHDLGSPDRYPAARADILPAAGFLHWRSGSGRGITAAVRPCAPYRNSIVLISVDEDIGQVVLQNEVQKLFSRTGDSPAILGVVVDMQSMSFGTGFEAGIVIGAVPAGVLDVMEVAVVVTHLMDKGSTDMLDRPCKGSCPDVDFVCGPHS
ncbi:MAG: hypothetical protein BHV88_00835 [Clostridiales bacterium 41_12_two_minus]|nr:MAG: hypothetical protein BHV88_00835 [Clostridiales bacterium 41_12_two_minus]